MRQKEFYAPQYLVDKITQEIMAFICFTTVFIVQKIGDHIFLTDENNTHLTQIAEKYGCRIGKIDSKIEIQTFQVPRALTGTSVASSMIIEQSNQFYSLLSVGKFPIFDDSIEIHNACRAKLSMVIESSFHI